jgi:hypothetical protein
MKQLICSALAQARALTAENHPGHVARFQTARAAQTLKPTARELPATKIMHAISFCPIVLLLLCISTPAAEPPRAPWIVWGTPVIEAAPRSFHEVEGNKADSEARWGKFVRINRPFTIDSGSPAGTHYQVDIRFELYARPHFVGLDRGMDALVEVEGYMFEELAVGQSSRSGRKALCLETGKTYNLLVESKLVDTDPLLIDYYAGALGELVSVLDLDADFIARSLRLTTDSSRVEFELHATDYYGTIFDQETRCEIVGGLHWAKGPKLADILPLPPVRSASFFLGWPRGENIVKGSVPVSDLLRVAPKEATHLILAVDRENKFAELDESNNILAIPMGVNNLPELTLPEETEIKSRRKWSDKATATDLETPTSKLEFVLLGGPRGLTVSRSGEMEWTPDRFQEGSTNIVRIKVTDDGQPSKSDTDEFIIVVAPNTPPTLSGDTFVIEELKHRNMEFGAGFDEETPEPDLVYELLSAPAGVGFNQPRKLLVWEPTEADGPSTNVVILRVTDDSSPRLSAISTFYIIVNETNQPPVLSGPRAVTATQGKPLTVQVAASDPDLPANKLTFSVQGATEGMSLDPATGLFTWRSPGGPSPLKVLLKVSDEDGLSATGELTITVKNAPPELAPIPGQVATAGEMWRLQVEATDPDSDEPLAYSVAGPGGLAISSNGAITWRPSDAQAGKSHVVSVSVSDEFDTTTLTFEVVVKAVPKVSFEVGGPNLRFSNKGFSFKVRLAPDVDRPQWVIERSTDFLNWTPLPRPPAASEADAVDFVDEAAVSLGRAYYRVRQLD